LVKKNRASGNEKHASYEICFLARCKFLLQSSGQKRRKSGL